MVQLSGFIHLLVGRHDAFLSCEPFHPLPVLQPGQRERE